MDHFVKWKTKADFWQAGIFSSSKFKEIEWFCVPGKMVCFKRIKNFHYNCYSPVGGLKSSSMWHLLKAISSPFLKQSIQRSSLFVQYFIMYCVRPGCNVEAASTILLSWEWETSQQTTAWSFISHLCKVFHELQSNSPLLPLVFSLQALFDWLHHNVLSTGTKVRTIIIHWDSERAKYLDLVF